MNTFHTTIEQINQGWNAQSEFDILPIYYDGDLVNGAAYRACQLKRLMNHAGDVAVRAYDTARQASLPSNPAIIAIGTTAALTAVALADKLFF